MTNKEAIERLEFTIGLIKQSGKVLLDERDIPMLKKAIETLQLQKCNPKKIELKPCPFCGGEAEMNVKHGAFGYTPDIYYVKCKRCGQKVELVSEDYKNLSNAVANTWNSRT